MTKIPVLLLLSVGLGLACNRSAESPPPASSGASAQPTKPAPSPPPASGPIAQAPPPSDPQPAVPPAEPPRATKLGAVLASALNVRRGAGTNHETLGQRLRCGDIVELLAKEGDWYHVKLDALDGWSHGSFIVEVRVGRGTPPDCRAEDDSGKAPPSRPKEVIVGPRHTKEIKQPDEKPAPEGIIEQAKKIVVPPRPNVAPPKTRMLAEGSTLAKIVPFPHEQHTHQGIGCIKCHHAPSHSGAAANEEKNCHKCHSPSGGSSGVRSKIAFHNTCKRCHEATGQGPTECAACHTGK